MAAGNFTIEVIDQVHGGPTVSYSLRADLGENLYKGMCRLEAAPCCGFTFQSEETSYGHFIIKINGLEQEESKQEYWMIYIDDLQHFAPVGVDELPQKAGVKYIFSYEHYVGDHANKVKK